MEHIVSKASSVAFKCWPGRSSYLRNKYPTQVSWTCSKFSGTPHIKLLLALLSREEKVVHLENEGVMLFFIRLCVSVPLNWTKGVLGFCPRPANVKNPVALYVQQPKLHSFQNLWSKEIYIRKRRIQAARNGIRSRNKTKKFLLKPWQPASAQLNPFASINLPTFESLG